MVNPVVLKHTLPMVLLTSGQAAALPIFATALLAIERWYFGAVFDQSFVLMLVLVLVLGAVLLQPERGLMPQLIGGRRELVTRLALRWLILLFLLLAIGYATKTSEDFSRRMVLTWAVTTPGFLIGIALLMHEAFKQLLADPETARRAVFAGYNDISVSLAQRVERTSLSALRIEGFFDDRAPERLVTKTLEAGVSGPTLRGGLKDIVPYVHANGIDVIFVALPVSHIARVQNLLDDLR